MSADRRKHRISQPPPSARRTTENLLIEYATADDLVRDYTEHFAVGTVFLETNRALPAGTPMRLQLTFPGLRQPLLLQGVVRWAPGQGAQPGLGVELAPGAGRSAHDALVERIRQGDPELISQLLRILVAEDNPHVAQLIRNGLQGVSRRHFGTDLAFDFRTAQNGREAIEFLHSEAFHALIVDMYMPVLDGVHVIEHVRADQDLYALPIVAVSAGGASARDSALRAGADHFLAKPMRLKQITQVIQKLFPRS